MRRRSCPRCADFVPGSGRLVEGESRRRQVPAADRRQPGAGLLIRRPIATRRTRERPRRAAAGNELAVRGDTRECSADDQGAGARRVRFVRRPNRGVWWFSCSRQTPNQLIRERDKGIFGYYSRAATAKASRARVSNQNGSCTVVGLIPVRSADPPAGVQPKRGRRTKTAAAEFRERAAADPAATRLDPRAWRGAGCVGAQN